MAETIIPHPNGADLDGRPACVADPSGRHRPRRPAGDRLTTARWSSATALDALGTGPRARRAGRPGDGHRSAVPTPALIRWGSVGLGPELRRGVVGLRRPRPRWCSILIRNLEGLGRIADRGARPRRRTRRLRTATARRTTNRSPANVQAHYDLGNDFFELHARPDDDVLLRASSSTPTSPSSEASTAKLDRICRKLDLGPERSRRRDRHGLGRLRRPRRGRTTAAGSRPPPSPTPSTTTPPSASPRPASAISSRCATTTTAISAAPTTSSCPSR